MTGMGDLQRLYLFTKNTSFIQLSENENKVLVYTIKERTASDAEKVSKKAMREELKLTEDELDSLIKSVVTKAVFARDPGEYNPEWHREYGILLQLSDEELYTSVSNYIKTETVNELEESYITVDGDIYSRFMETSMALYHDIINRSAESGEVSYAEAEWANTFIEYADALKLIEVKNNDSDE